MRMALYGKDMPTKKRDDCLYKIREYAKEINSPLSIQDIGLLVEYGQTGEARPFSDYMKIWEKWLQLLSDYEEKNNL